MKRFVFLLCLALSHCAANAQFQPSFNLPPRTASAVQLGATGVPTVFSRLTVPIIVASTGSMANNGAISALTALPTTYPSVYLTLPAGAIAAGVPASTDTYYAQMSSTTAGTVCNNRMADNLDGNGVPVAPASCTAFSTTGPGAFTGVTGAVTLVTLTLPAGLLGTVGVLDGVIDFVYNTTANNKVTTVAFGGTSLYNANIASNGYLQLTTRVRNKGSASVQSMSAVGSNSGGNTGSGAAYGAVNTANAVSITIAVTHATATDNAGVEGFTFLVTR